jgi:enamine deaminase RidA (YjgF/YER057c/UK114 family)
MVRRSRKSLAAPRSSGEEFSTRNQTAPVVFQLAAMHDSRTQWRVNISPDGDLFFVGTTTGPVAADHAATALYRQLNDALAEHRAQIVQERVFGNLSVESQVLAARQAVLGDSGPLSYVEGAPLWGDGLAGIIVRAVPGDVRPVTLNGVVRGRAWDGQIILQALQGETSAVIAEAEQLLQQHGTSYRQVARTWFYLDDILRWYGEFNRLRNTAYTTVGLIGPTGARLPASTGINGRNAAGQPLSLDLLAVTGQGTFTVLHNPRQPEALDYGSAFARAVHLGSLLEISGTAAIDPAGHSVHDGDAPAQVAYTLEAMAALIQPTGASLRDMLAGCLFLKRREDRAAAAELLAELPLVGIWADVCRPELLVEIDAEIAVPRT